METIKINGKWQAISPIHTGASEQLSTTRTIRMEETLGYVDGVKKLIQVPVISGNSVRGNLRRLIMEDFVNKLGYTIESVKLYHFLFTGGILEVLNSSDKGNINIELKSRILELIPPISLLGSAIGNQMFTGKLKVGQGNLICKETQEYYGINNADFSAYELLSTEFGTRKDDLIGQYEKDEGDQNTQMKYEFEVIKKGAEFQHDFYLMDTNEVEKGCFNTLLDLWRERPFVGGMSGTGHGKISFQYDNDNYFNYDSTIKAYNGFIDENMDDIKDFLQELELKLSKK